MEYTTRIIKNETAKLEIEFINSKTITNELKKLTYNFKSANVKNYKAQSLKFFCV